MALSAEEIIATAMQLRSGAQLGQAQQQGAPAPQPQGPKTVQMQTQSQEGIDRLAEASKDMMDRGSGTRRIDHPAQGYAQLAETAGGVLTDHMAKVQQRDRNQAMSDALMASPTGEYSTEQLGAIMALDPSMGQDIMNQQRERTRASTAADEQRQREAMQRKTKRDNMLMDQAAQNQYTEDLAARDTAAEATAAQKLLDEQRTYTAGEGMETYEAKKKIDQQYAKPPKVDKPKVATGYRLTEEGTAEVIPGSKAEKEIDQERSKAQGKFDTMNRDWTNQIKTIDEAIGQVGFMTTGLTGSVVGSVPGTDAYDLGANIETIIANLGFDKLQAMRDNSPTGGALGQVTERELALLQSSVENLKQGQSEEQLLANLQDIRERILSVQEAYGGHFNNMYGDAGGGVNGDDPLNLLNRGPR